MELQLFASPFQDPSCPQAVCIMEDMTSPQQVNGAGAGGLLYKETRGLEVVWK